MVVSLSRSHVGNVAAAIYLAIDLGIVGDIHQGGSLDTSYLSKVGVDIAWGYTCTAAEYVAIYLGSLDVNFSIAFYLTCDVSF